MEFNLLSLILQAVLAFGATNIDDIFLLALWFSQTGSNLTRPSIIAGQYLGFAGLVAISLLGLLVGLMIPQTWIGLLGLFPIAIGVQKLLASTKGKQSAGAGETDQPAPKANHGVRSAVWQVAAVTFANGGDNIGIYTPFFASTGFPQVIVILIVFFLLVAVWCALGYWVSRQRAVGSMLSRYGHRLVPFVLIGLGIAIPIQSETYRLIFP